MVRYIDGALRPARLKSAARSSVPVSAILLAAAFFLSVLSPEATEPNALIHLAYFGAVQIAGLLR